jgi:hypothetical protein
VNADIPAVNPVFVKLATFNKYEEIRRDAILEITD